MDWNIGPAMMACSGAERKRNVNAYFRKEKRFITTMRKEAGETIKRFRIFEFVININKTFFFYYLFRQHNNACVYIYILWRYSQITNTVRERERKKKRVYIKYKILLAETE